MLIKRQQGMDRRRAAIDVVKQTALPLLGATVIAVPANADAHDPGFAVADMILASLTEFSLDLVAQR